jgi:hypothetical protein
MSIHRTDNTKQEVPTDDAKFAGGPFARSCDRCSNFFPASQVVATPKAIYKCLCFECLKKIKPVVGYKTIKRLRDQAPDLLPFVKKD